MSKVDIKRLDSVTKNDTTATEQINDNFQALQAAIENTVSRDGTVPNYMDADLDLNSYRIINAGDPVGERDVVTLKYFEEKAGGAIEAAAEAKASASKAASSAHSALVASNNAIGQLAQAEGLLTATEQYVDAAKADINTAVSDAESTISTIVSDAEGSITNIAVTEANKAIANAAQEATDMATANVNSYVDGTVKPSLQTYADQAQEDANSAATSMEQAALSATAASNYADNAAESAGMAANSATEASNSEEKAAEYLQQINNKITVVEGSIGDIGFAPLGIDEAQNKRRYLNGQVISQAQFVSFTNKIKAAIQLYSNLATTETNWQAEVTNSKLGQCGKFVIDDTAGTIRLPKVVNIQGLQDLALMGSVKAESLPNIKGATSLIVDGDYIFDYGAFYKDSVNKKAGVYGYKAGTNAVNAFDASRSSPTYQDNAPVQQEAVQYPYFIQVATGVETSIDITREIELNNPFFLGMSQYFESEPKNASWLISNGSFHSGTVYKSFYEWLLKIYNGTETVGGVSVKASTDTYNDYDFVINTTNQTFRLPLLNGAEDLPSSKHIGIALSGTTSRYIAPANGFYVIAGTGLGWVDLVNETSGGIGACAQPRSTDGYGRYSVFARAGDQVAIFCNSVPAAGVGASFIYAKGNGSLYFYVGETIQDANIIAASQVLTKVANGIDRTVATDRETVVGWGMPSSRYIGLTLGAADSIYTAPANGWVVLAKKTNAANQYVFLSQIPNQTSSQCWCPLPDQYVQTYIPVRKGCQFTVIYSAGGELAQFKFVYAEGEN